MVDVSSLFGLSTRAKSGRIIYLYRKSKHRPHRQVVGLGVSGAEKQSGRSPSDATEL
jgi:hypothetical protein